MGKRKSPETCDTEDRGGKVSKHEVDSKKNGKRNPESYLMKKKRQAASMQRPKVFMKVGGQHADKTLEKETPQIYTRDLQYLLLFALRKGLNYDQPWWCQLLRPAKMKSVMLIVVNDVSMTDFKDHSHCFPFIQEIFNENLRVGMVNPRQYFSTLNFDMYGIPFTCSQIKGFKKKHGSATHRKGKQVVFSQSASLPCSDPNHAASLWISNHNNRYNSSGYGSGSNDPQSYSRLHLVLSAPQMLDENFPLPGAPESQWEYADFVPTKQEYDPLTSKSPLFAVDCEMCLTSTYKHELTRVSITNEQNEVMYDELVKPHNPIINYLTRFSGITKKMLDPVTKRIEEVQKDISKLLPKDAILCGQSLGNDLSALKMFHPYVIDTSVIYNLSGNRKMKCSLKRLAHTFLGRVIQESRGGHSSAEDAMATMDLVKFKLQHSETFGDTVLGWNIMPYLPTLDASYTDPHQTERIAGTSGTDQDGGQQGVGDQPDMAMMMRSFFDILSELEVTCCQIGGKKLMSMYREEEHVKSYPTTNDRDTAAKAREVSADNMFTWVEFSPFCNQQAAAQEPTEEELEVDMEDTLEGDQVMKKRLKTLRSVDKHIKNVMEQLPEKCLVAVAMTGSKGSESQLEAAAVLLHIT